MSHSSKKRKSHCHCGRCEICRKKSGKSKRRAIVVEDDDDDVEILDDMPMVSGSLEPPSYLPHQNQNSDLEPISFLPEQNQNSNLVPSNLEPPPLVEKTRRKRISPTLVTPNLEPPTTGPVMESDFYGVQWDDRREEDLNRRLYFSQLGQRFIEENYPEEVYEDETADILYSWLSRCLSKKLGDSQALKLLDQMMKK